MSKKENSIQFEDILDSKYITIWKDGDFVYLQIYGTSIAITKKDWTQIKKKLKHLK